MGSVQNFNTMNGMLPNGGLQRPMPSYPGSTPVNTSMMSTSNVTARGPDPTSTVDEGKMSVSIDFGKSCRLLIL